MLAHVLAGIDAGQIGRVVVERVPIDMVNVLPKWH